MKTLYESILDDEDVLVDKTNTYINNPFELLKILYDKYGNIKKIPINDIKKIVKLIDIPYSLSHLSYMVTCEGDLIILDDKGFNQLFDIRMVVSETNSAKYWMIIKPSEIDYNIKYIWKSKNKQEQYFKNMFKKYNINYEKRLYDLYNSFYLKNK